MQRHTGACSAIGAPAVPSGRLQCHRGAIAVHARRLQCHRGACNAIGATAVPSGRLQCHRCACSAIAVHAGRLQCHRCACGAPAVPSLCMRGPGLAVRGIVPAPGCQLPRWPGRGACIASDLVWCHGPDWASSAHHQRARSPATGHRVTSPGQAGSAHHQVPRITSGGHPGQLSRAGLASSPAITSPGAVVTAGVCGTWPGGAPWCPP